jgi:Flp pilus assembly protein TadD
MLNISLIKQASKLCSFVLLSALAASAGDIRISIPKRTKPTPVQKYNQEGVKDLKKNKVSDAKKQFYKAYLLDPNDPFTLNNLGYIAELEGEVDRATRYYDLAQANASEAVVEKASSKSVEGKEVSQIAGRTENGPFQVNRANVVAISLLEKDRAYEAQKKLEAALQADPGNAFTLNNLGYAMEKQGELDSALKYYQKAAASDSDDRVIVAVEAHKDWRGKRITDVAQRNAEKVSKQLRDGESPEQQVARLNLRGVSALNRNDRASARSYFQQANKLDPENAFTLNNMGYLAELDGDRETAKVLYAKAQDAERSRNKVGVATRADAEGKPLARVADKNEDTMANKMATDLAARRKSGEAPELKKRDGSTVQTVAPPKDKKNDQALPASDQTQPEEPKADTPRTNDQQPDSPK